MRSIISIAIGALTLCSAHYATAQGTAKGLVMVVAHGDDEGAAAPILARYAREGVQVHLIIATDGAQGGAHTTIPRGPELARVRTEEARCATAALGINAAILLGFPDGMLGAYVADASLLYRLTQRLAEELQRLRADALITWGPDGGTGHADHRLVSSIVTQLVMAGAPGAPERLFYAYLPAGGFTAINQARGTPRAAPPLLIPQEKYFTTKVSFTPADYEAGLRSMACHKTQYSDEVVHRIGELSRQVWNGVLPFIPFSTANAGTDLLPR